MLNLVQKDFLKNYLENYGQHLKSGSIKIFTGVKTKKKRSTSSRSTDSTISAKDMERIVEKLKTQDVRETTKNNYYAIWKNFNKFFIRLDVKPTSWEDRIILFIGHLVNENRKSQTIKSYLSAIQTVLRHDGVELQQDRFLISSLTKACKLKNDRVKTCLPIQKPMLEVILKYTKTYFLEQNQYFLALLYQTIFITGYYGMFRIGELTSGTHPVNVGDVHIGDNKAKLKFILRTSKTHGIYSKPQVVKIAKATFGPGTAKKEFCPFNLLQEYIEWRPKYTTKSEPFFVFRDTSPVKPSQARQVLKEMINNAGFNNFTLSMRSEQEEPVT